MKKLLCLALMILIFGIISTNPIEDEWNNNVYEPPIIKVKKFLQKYGIYDDIVIFIKENKIGVAKLLCSKVIGREAVCDEAISILEPYINNEYKKK